MSIPLPADEPRVQHHVSNGSGPARQPGARPVIDVEIDTVRPRVELRVRAEKDGVPLVRQALRALALATGAEPDSLQDAELAVTEAAANAVLHAYRDGEGVFEVSLEARARDMLAIVRDEGRGMGDAWDAHGHAHDGLGLAVIESIASDVEIRSARDEGTEVVMALPGTRYEPLDEEATTPGEIVEQVVRRLVALAAAQVDVPTARVTEVLLAAEMIARHAVHHVTVDHVHVLIDYVDGGIELHVGPLEAGGTSALLDDADVPTLGSVIERFADKVWAVPAPESPSGVGERLAARFMAG